MGGKGEGIKPKTNETHRHRKQHGDYQGAKGVGGGRIGDRRDK